MSILETFYILFKSDTSNLKKGSEEALNTTKKLNQSLKETDNISGRLGEKFLGILAPLSGILAGFASVNAVISGFKNTLDYDIELGKTSRALGVNAEQLDTWDNAVRQAGGTAEGFQNSLKNLSEHFNTNPSVALRFLPQLADVFSKVSRFSAFKLGKSLGLDEATILLLQQGRREVESALKQQRELGVVTQKDIELTTEYNKSLLNLQHGFRTLANAVESDLLPYLIKFFNYLTKGFEYLSQHKDVVIGSLIGIGAALGIIFAEQILITGSVLLMIALVGILYEDFKAFLSGSNSLTGELIDKFNNFVDSIGLSIFEITKNKNAWKKWGENIKDVVKKAITDLLSLINPLSFIHNKLSEILGFGSSSGKYVGQEIGKRFLNDASSSPINSASSNGVINSSLFNRNNNINISNINMDIQTNDAQGVAYGLRAELNKYFTSQTEQASANSADNVYV
jgi:hypothetical protein